MARVYLYYENIKGIKNTNKLDKADIDKLNSEKIRIVNNVKKIDRTIRHYYSIEDVVKSTIESKNKNLNLGNGIQIYKELVRVKMKKNILLYFDIKAPLTISEDGKCELPNAFKIIEFFIKSYNEQKNTPLLERTELRELSNKYYITSINCKSIKINNKSYIVNQNTSGIRSCAFSLKFNNLSSLEIDKLNILFNFINTNSLNDNGYGVIEVSEGEKYEKKNY